MILFLDNNVLPGIKPDLSDLVESYAKNIIRDDVYHNVIVDKYEMAEQWNVPFVELLPSQDKDRKIAVIIGTCTLPTRLPIIFAPACAITFFALSGVRMSSKSVTTTSSPSLATVTVARVEGS